MEPIATCTRVTVGYRNHSVLRQFSCELRPGDFAVLAGGNGSGKTTVLRSLLGFVRPRQGEITLFGERLTPRSARTLRRRIGYVPQCPAVDARMPMSVRDVVAIGRCAWVGPGRRLRLADHEKVAQALAAVGILPLAERPFGQLSGGEQQKTQIARAMCQEPDLLLLDEPTNSLDLGARCECLELLARIHRLQGIALLLVMHDLEALPPSCNRALVLAAGALAYDGNVAGLFREANLRCIYGANAARVLRQLRLPSYQRAAAP